MPILSSRFRGGVLALLVLVMGVANARTPSVRKGINHPPQSITPKPKEWAMDDDPLTPPPPPRQAPQQGAPGSAQAHAPAANAGSASAPAGNVERATGTAALESAPVAPTRTPKVLPLFWLAVTAVMSLGALAMCATLILREETPAGDDVPVVPDALEVKA